MVDHSSFKQKQYAIHSFTEKPATSAGIFEQLYIPLAGKADRHSKIVRSIHIPDCKDTYMYSTRVLVVARPPHLCDIMLLFSPRILYILNSMIEFLKYTATGFSASGVNKKIPGFRLPQCCDKNSTRSFGTQKGRLVVSHSRGRHVTNSN